MPTLNLSQDELEILTAILVGYNDDAIFEGEDKELYESVRQKAIGLEYKQ